MSHGRLALIVVVIVAGVGASAALVSQRDPAAAPAPRTTAVDDADAAQLVRATLAYGRPMREATSDRLAAPRRRAIERCLRVFQGSPPERHADLEAFYGAALTQPAFLAVRGRLRRWAAPPPASVGRDEAVDDARAALREELALLEARFAQPIDVCSDVAAWRRAGWTIADRVRSVSPRAAHFLARGNEVPSGLSEPTAVFAAINPDDAFHE